MDNLENMIKLLKDEFGADCLTGEGLSDYEIKNAAADFKEDFGMILPEEIQELFGYVNGFELGAFRIFGFTEFMEKNSGLPDEDWRLLYMGNCGEDMFAYVLPPADYYGVFDKETRDAVKIGSIADILDLMSERLRVQAACARSDYFLIQPKPYELVSRFSGGLAAVKYKGKWGYVDKRGHMAIPAIYEEAGDFDGGFACVVLNGKLRVIDAGGGTVLETEYQGVSAYTEFSNGRIHVTANGLSGCIDMKGNIIVPLIYDKLEKLDSGYAEACIDDKWGLVDKTGKAVLPLVYEDIIYHCGTVAFKLDGLWGIMDLSWNVLTPPMYDDVHLIGADEIAVKKGDLHGVVTAGGTEIIPVRYENLNIDDYEKGSPLGACIGGKYGFIDARGNTIIPFVYDSVGSFNYGRAVVVRDGKIGMIDKNGSVAIPLDYDEIIDCCNELTVAQKDGKTYLLDGGKPAFPPIVCECDFFSQGLMWVKIGGLWGAVGKPDTEV